MSHPSDLEERPRGKRVKNPVSADLWYEEQARAEQQRLAARVVVSAAVCLKDVNLPEEELRRRLLSVGHIENLPVLFGEDGTVSACDAFLNVGDAHLTEEALVEQLRAIGRVDRAYFTFEGEAEEEAR